jgi:hypothetical protein
MEQDRERAIELMLEQIMVAVEANLRAVTAELRAFDFAAHAVGQSHIGLIVKAHGSAVQEAQRVTEALEHWGAIFGRDLPEGGDVTETS